jgi:hypothetical protein
MPFDKCPEQEQEQARTGHVPEILGEDAVLYLVGQIYSDVSAEYEQYEPG